MINIEFGDRRVVDPTRLAAFVRAGGGPIVRDNKRRAGNVQTGAKLFVRKRTRALERSILTTTDVLGMKVTSTVGAYTPYALMEHDGTRPHVIQPRNRKALRFPVNGHVVFSRRVQHPGTRGSFFLARALPFALH